MKNLNIFFIVFLILPINLCQMNHSETMCDDISNFIETIFVGGSGPNNFTSIQSAIIYADEGDIIFIYEGTYFENIVINKQLQIIGEDKEDTIIDGSCIGNVVEFSSCNINLSTVTVQNSGNEFTNSGVIILSNNSILFNVIIKDTNWGIYLTEYSEKVEIKNNIISNNIRGIYSFTGSKNNIIAFNTIINNTYSGIFFYATQGNIIEKNAFFDNGNGFVVDYSNNNTIIMNEITNNVYDGIILIDSSNYNFISNNSISGHHLGGIYLGDNSSFNIIDKNSIYSNTDGIVVEFSHSNNVSNNIIDFNEQFGISLTESNNNIVKKNTVENCDSYGLNLVDSDDNLIEENTIEFNNESGVTFFWSNRNVIRKNNFDHNTPLHIQLRSSSEDNIIYLNNFLNNSCSISDFITNSWDFKGKGNYWSDYIERYPDANKLLLKGVWNTPYEIPDNDNKDSYPLIKKWPNCLSATLDSQNKLIYIFYHLFFTQNK